MGEVFTHLEQLFSENGEPSLRRQISSSNVNIQENLVDVRIAQPAILASSLAFYQLLRQLEIKPDCVVGHSYGEFTAAFAAEIFNAKALQGLTSAARLLPLERNNQMSMAALGTSSNKAEDILRIIPGEVFIANKNCPVQTVIAGERIAVSTAMQVCKCLKITADLLPINQAFHCPLSQDFHSLLTKELRSTTISPPKLPLYSSITGERYSENVENTRSVLSDLILKTC